MLKQIFMPVSIVASPISSLYSTQKERFLEQIQKAESDLNAALDEGYEIKSSHVITTSQETGIQYLLHLPSQDTLQGKLKAAYARIEALEQEIESEYEALTDEFFMGEEDEA